MEDTQLQVSRLYRFEGDTKLKALVDIAFGGIIVKGLSVVEGSKGLFVSMPRQKGKDGKWYNSVSPTTKEIKQEIENIVLAAYNAAE